MNERIYKLMVESDCISLNFLNNNIGKFAELIVRECAKVILETPVKYTEIDTMHRIRDNVKAHFGVENDD